MVRFAISGTQSTTILFFLMMSLQRRDSSATKAAISAGLLPTGSTLAARNFACTSGILIVSPAALAISEPSGGGVFGGAASANQPVDTRPGSPASAVVGISGSMGERWVAPRARILTAPTRTGGPPAAMLPKNTST